MTRLFFSVLAAGLLVVCGLVHGYWTDRWLPPTDLERASERMEEIPMTVGDWDGHALEVKPTSLDYHLAGHLARRYVNRVTGETVAIALVVGRPGPVAIHTPDVCYAAGGYAIAPQADAEVPGRSDVFGAMNAVRSRASEETRLRLLWAWNAGKAWETASQPRLEFAHHRVLYKLYVSRDLNTIGEPSHEDSCVAFLQTFLPALDEVLFRKEP